MPRTKDLRRAESSCCSIAHTEVVEDYLKTVFKLGTPGAATTSGLAGELGVAAPTASAMLKRLEASGLVTRLGDHRVELTEHGLRHALAVVRRHRLLEMFLAQVLQVPWDEVHAEAEILEHALSPQLEQRIDALLGRPTRDPHGDPIPPASGPHVEDWATPLTVAPAGSRFEVERVSDRDSEVLRYLALLGIRPGAQLAVVEWAPFGGPLWVELDGTRHALGSVVVHAVHGRVL